MLLFCAPFIFDSCLVAFGLQGTRPSSNCLLLSLHPHLFWIRNWLNFRISSNAYNNNGMAFNTNRLKRCKESHLILEILMLIGVHSLRRFAAAVFFPLSVYSIFNSFFFPISCLCCGIILRVSRSNQLMGTYFLI